MTHVFTDDDLYAYLDGELAEEDRTEFESRLAADADLTQRLKRAQNTWQMLEHLGPVSQSDNLTKSTMAMAAVELERRSPTESLRHNGQLVVGSLLALVIGFGVVFVSANMRTQKQLSDLPIINDLDLYRRAGSVAFLRELGDAGLFLPDFALAEVLGSDDSAGSPYSANMPGDLLPFAGIAETRSTIKAMTESQIMELQRKRETFESLKASEQERLRQLHFNLAAAEDRQRLYSVLIRYQQWLKSLSPAQRVEMQSVKSLERIDRIRELQSEQERLRFAELELNEAAMPDEDVDTIMRWMREYLKRHEADFAEQIPEHVQRWAGGSRHRWRILPVLVSQGRINAVAATNDEFTQLIKDASKELAPKLRRLEADARVELIQSWLTSWGKSVRPPHPDVSHEQLGRFIRNELSQDDRKRMSALPGPEARKELMRLYFRMHPKRNGFPRQRDQSLNSQPSSSQPHHPQSGDRPQQP